MNEKEHIVHFHLYRRVN